MANLNYIRNYHLTANKARKLDPFDSPCAVYFIALDNVFAANSEEELSGTFFSNGLAGFLYLERLDDSFWVKSNNDTTVTVVAIGPKRT